MLGAGQGRVEQQSHSSAGVRKRDGSVQCIGNVESLEPKGTKASLCFYPPSGPTSSPFLSVSPGRKGRSPGVMGVRKASWRRRHLKESPTEYLLLPTLLSAFRVFCGSVALKPP